MVGIPPLRQQDYLRMTVGSIIEAQNCSDLLSETIRNSGQFWILRYPRYESKTAAYNSAKFQILPEAWMPYYQALHKMWALLMPERDIATVPLLMTLKQKNMNGIVSSDDCAFRTN